MPDRRGLWALLPVLAFLQLSHGSPARATPLTDTRVTTNELLFSVVVPETGAGDWQKRALDVGAILAKSPWRHLRFPLDAAETTQAVWQLA